MEEKKLYRSRTNRTVLGICGGLAEYFGKDATLFRLIFLVLLVCTGFAPFGLSYLLAYFVMPLEPENKA
ncbi:MAG: PspC domain-containing protein [Elusimicrobiales bacterium]